MLRGYESDLAIGFGGLVPELPDDASIPRGSLKLTDIRLNATITHVSGKVVFIEKTEA